MQQANVQVIGRTGSHWARVDNSGTRDAGATLNVLLEEHWDEGGLDLFLAPGTYLIEQPIVVARGNVAIQGYTFRFCLPAVQPGRGRGAARPRLGGQDAPAGGAVVPGRNPGKVVFDVDGFRGGTVSDNAFMFNHEQVQCFARLRHCSTTHVSGNTFVVDGAGPRGYGRFGDTAARGYRQDGERYDTLTMAGCSDCTVAGNSLLSFNREHPVIRLGADRETGAVSHHNRVTLNKVLPSTGSEERPQVELTEGTEANLVVLPMAAGPAARQAVLDRGSANQICALPTALDDTGGSHR